MWFNFQGVEKGLVEQINYLTEVATGQPHEGSIYGAEKVRLHRYVIVSVIYTSRYSNSRIPFE